MSKPWPEEKDDLLIKLVLAGELSYTEMSPLLDNVSPSYIANRVQKFRADGKLPPITQKRKRAEKRKKKGQKANDGLSRKIWEKIKDKGMSVRMLSNVLDRSAETIIDTLDQMEIDGYYLIRAAGVVQASTTIRPTVPTPARTLADEAGMIISIGIISDQHHGGRCAQPSALKRCYEIMGNEYGVRHFLDPGDSTTGIYMYRGHDEDVIPTCRPLNKKMSGIASENQLWLLEKNMPREDDAEWFMIGGNHDWTHVKYNGIDILRKFCDRHENVHYMGYDSAGLWLTDKIYLRLWHPAGGIPYAKSYRLQKGIEGLAIEALKKAIALDQTPVTSMLIAGHLHITCELPDIPIPAMHVGCFEGKTNYLKRKGYDPSIGGTVVRMLVTDAGKIQRIERTRIAFEEVKDDWLNWPIPDDIGYRDYNPDQLDAIFKFIPKGDKDVFVLNDPRSNWEYVGGK